MAFDFSAELMEYLCVCKEETISLIEALCGIPAPSGKEEKRAVFCRHWLTAQGAEGVYIDDAGNVLYPVGCAGRDDIILFAAHTDTVFPDTEPMPFVRENGYLCAPGVGDDTANLAILLMIARYVAQKKLQAPCGILFAADVGEEGLGNLRGIRQIMQDYAGRIQKVYSFDLHYDAVYNRCVGSHRYEITVETEGGHSFQDFGAPNAIAILSDLICRLYQCQVPVCENSKTTFNVGTVDGGTSVNTIAPSARCLYEYRSDSAECLEQMRLFWEEELRKTKEQAKVLVKTVGIRPCGGAVNEAVLSEMSRQAVSVCQKHSQMPCVCASGSTDCNIPMSLGVPAICVGLCTGSGIHTREEKVQIDSIPAGLRIAAELILQYFSEN